MTDHRFIKSELDLFDEDDIGDEGDILMPVGIFLQTLNRLMAKLTEEERGHAAIYVSAYRDDGWALPVLFTRRLETDDEMNARFERERKARYRKSVERAAKDRAEYERLKAIFEREPKP